MTEVLYRSTTRFTSKEVTLELLALPEFSWMTPAEPYLGMIIVMREGSEMIAAVLTAEQFALDYESEDAIATSVASRDPI